MSNSELPRRCPLSTRLLLAAVLAAWSCDTTPPTAPPPTVTHFYVGNRGGFTPPSPPSITVYAADAKGDATPTATIVSRNAGLTAPQGIARDRTGRLYVANQANVGSLVNSSNNSILIFGAGATGSAAPTDTIWGGNTRLFYPGGIAVDTAGRLYVTNSNDSITIYPAGATGNATPIATIAGSNTGLLSPCGIAVDGAGRIYVANHGKLNYLETLSGFSVTIYAAGATGNAAPIATIAGSSTGLSAPCGIALDPAGRIYVTNQKYCAPNGPNCPLAGETSITVYAAGATGNVLPTAKIAGPHTGLSPLLGIAVDTAGRVYVANCCGAADSVRSITVYAAGATGDVIPTTTIAGINTGLDWPIGIALDGAGTLSVANNPGPGQGRLPSITVYAARATGNATPIATITGGDTRPGALNGIARDADGRLYVTSPAGTYSVYGSCISVYAPGATGNAVPVATIQGSNTNLYAPGGITLDGAGRVYVLNGNTGGIPSITVYARGASGNVTPTAQLQASTWGSNPPSAIAVDVAGRLYVVGYRSASVTVYAPGATGDPAPAAVIAGDRTGLSSPVGIAVDGAGRVYVLNLNNTSFTSSVIIYAPGATGNAAPTATIQGGGNAIAVDAAGRLYVARGNAITIYAAGATGNATPTATITGPSTGLDFPVAITF